MRIANLEQKVSPTSKTCVQQVACIYGLKMVSCDDEAIFCSLSGFADTKQQVAVACLLHWQLQQINERGAAVMLSVSTVHTFLTLAELFHCEKALLESDKVKVLGAQMFVQQLLEIRELKECMVQIVDCREQNQYLGLVSDEQVSGHFDGARNVPFASIFTAVKKEEVAKRDAAQPTIDRSGKKVSFLPLDEMRHVFDVNGVDLDRPISLVASIPAEAAAVATALLLAGQTTDIRLCIEPLTDTFIASFPNVYTTNIFREGQLLYKDDKGEFDLSPESREILKSSVEVETIKNLEKAFNDMLMETARSKNREDHFVENKMVGDEVVWIKGGRRFFDMPSPVSKNDFLDASRTIFCVVSFVLAPFGFPASLRKKRSLQEVKALCGSLFQDVLEVCSDLVYQEKELNEGAMAMSVHKWVEEKHDSECSSQIKAINELWEVLYSPPAVVEVPDLCEDQILSLAKLLQQKMHELVSQRTPWAYDYFDEEEVPSDEESEFDPHEKVNTLEKDGLCHKEQDDIDGDATCIGAFKEKCTSEAATTSKGKRSEEFIVNEEVVSGLGTDKQEVTIDEISSSTVGATEQPAIKVKSSKAGDNINQQYPQLKDKVSKKWKTMYPCVVYALGFIPQNLGAGHKKLSTLQIKSFIQAVAEASWTVVKDKKWLSQIEFQALCETLQNGKRKQLTDDIFGAEDSLYVLKHFFTRTLKTNDSFADKLAAVRDAVLDGEKHRRSGCYQFALAAYSKAFEYLPLYHLDLENTIVARAKCFFEMHELSRAKTEALIALKLNPYSVGAYECLGSVEDKSEHPDEALQNHVASFILDGSRSAQHAESIDRASRLVGRRVAKALFVKMEKKHELPSAWLVHSYFESFEHDVDNAVRVPHDIAKMEGVPLAELDTITLFYRAIHYKRIKDYGASQQDIWAVVVKDMQQEGLSLEDRAVALNLHASLLYVAGDVHMAIDVMNESLHLQPTLINSLVKKGGFLAEVGDKVGAISCFSEAIELDSNEADVYLHLGQVKLVEGDYYEAVQSLRRCISRSDALPATHLTYGMALYKSGSTYHAKDVFKKASQKFPESAEVHLFHGEVLADQGNYADAMRHFLFAWELSPQCPLPFLYAGRVYISTNDPMRAIAHFKQALEVDPRCSSAHLDIAQVLFAQGRTGEAFKHYEEAASCCRFLPELEEVCACQKMATMQLKVTEILGVELRHIMRSNC